MKIKSSYLAVAVVVAAIAGAAGPVFAADQLQDQDRQRIQDQDRIHDNATGQGAMNQDSLENKEGDNASTQANQVRNRNLNQHRVNRSSGAHRGGGVAKRGR